MFEQNDMPSDVLPTYPSSVSGELRIILQVKDQFLICFKYLETFQSLWEQQNRIITKDFILDQVKNGEIEIEQLESELALEKETLASRERHNDALINELRHRGEYYVAETSKLRVKGCRTALYRSCNKNIQSILIGIKDVGFVTVLEGIAERIDSAQNELRENLRPLLEYYKDIYYLQLHYTLALTQVSCYCMPLMTDTISIIDRLFFWAERPEFELIKKSGQICDRLRDIYTRLQRILCRLYDSVNFLQDRIELQRMLEIKFYEKIRLLRQTKDSLLEDIYSIKMQMDLLEEENDRLVGTLIKIDSNFAETEAFMLYAEHKKFTSQFDSRMKSSKDSSSKRTKGKNTATYTSASLDDNKKTDSSVNMKEKKIHDTANVHYENYENLKKIFNRYSEPNHDKSNHNSMSKMKSSINTSNNLEKWKINLQKMFESIKLKSRSESNLVEIDNLTNIDNEKILEKSRLPSKINKKHSSRSMKYKIKGETKSITIPSVNPVIELNSGTTQSSSSNQATDCLVLSSDIFPNDT